MDRTWGNVITKLKRSPNTVNIRTTLTLSLRRVCCDIGTDSKNKRVPPEWRANGEAGRNWMLGFKTRLPDLTLRLASLGRATAFNKHDVGAFVFWFFERCSGNVQHRAAEYLEYGWDCHRTYVLHKPKRVSAEKSVSVVGGMTSTERSALVTLALATSAAPPFYICPLVKCHDHFFEGAGPLAGGVAGLSGWMKAPQFEKFHRYFVKHARPTKKFYKIAYDSCTLANPGKTMSFYRIPTWAKDTIIMVANPLNIQSGFWATNI